MSEARLARTRRTLPEGYQFGDAGRPDLLFDRNAFALAMWPLVQPQSDVIYGLGYFRTPGWNVIEGEDDGA